MPSACHSQSWVKAARKHAIGLKHVKGSSARKGRNVSLPAVGKIRNDELKLPKRHLGVILGKMSNGRKTEINH